MKRTTTAMPILLLPLILLSGHVQAQLYKSVGPDGKITYSDTPPQANQKLLEKKELSGSASAANFPYELGQAVAKNPVTLYTAANCTPCNEGKNLLKSAGVPFSEKTVKTSEDIEKLKQVSGDTQLPVMQIGGKKLRGYNADDWKSAISAAAYPASNMLPPDYRYPAAESAAPAAPATSAEKPAPQKKTANVPVRKPASENDFRF